MYLIFCYFSVIVIMLCTSNLVVAETEFDELTVIATRINNNIDKRPNSVTIISAEDLQQYKSKTLPEILALKAGLPVRSSFGNNASRSVIDIRGFGATGTQNTLILLDGKRLNDIDQSTINFSAIPINNIERIEIIRGSGGVLYGEGAVGGVINIITKRTAENTREFSFQQRYGSYDSWQTDGAARYGQDDFSLNLFANRISSDGYRKNNQLEQYNLQTDLRYQPGETEYFAKFGFSDQALGLPGNRTVDLAAGLDELTNDRRGTNNPDDYAEEEVYFLTLGARGKFHKSWEYIIDAGLRHKQQISDIPSQPRYIVTDLETLFFTPRITTRLAAAGVFHNLNFGFDLYHYQYDSDIANSFTERNQLIRNLDISQNNYSAYLNDLIEVNDKTFINIGGRYQYVELDANDNFNPAAPGAAFDAEAPDSKRSDNEYFFNLGIKREFNAALSSYMNWGQSVRFANVDDINQVSFPPPTFTAIREFTNLKPQRSRQFDVGLLYETDQLIASINLYHMSLRNEIHFNPISFLNVNLDPTVRKGLEFNFEWSINNQLKTSFNYNLIRSVFVEGAFDGNDVPLTPKNTFHLSTEYTINPATDLIASWSYIGDKFFDNDQNNNFGRKIPSHSFVDLGLNYRYQDFSISMNVNNLLDKKTFDSGVSSTFTPGRFNALPLPERNYAIIIGVTF